MKQEIASDVPEDRVRSVNGQPLRSDATFVLYWMTAFRRTRYNFALQYARDAANQLGRPLVVLEALRTRYRWASQRFHRFIIEGMHDNQRAFQASKMFYYPYVEPRPGAGSGLLNEFANRSCLVVSDDYPCFFHPQMIRAVASRLPARLVLIDSNGLMPLSAGQRTFTVAHSYRRFMQKELPKHLEEFPESNPLDAPSTRSMKSMRDLPLDLTSRWPIADLDNLLKGGRLAEIPIDHRVPSVRLGGGPRSAETLLQRFLSVRLGNYEHDRNEPDQSGSSELSPHLHFGHVSAHEIFARLMAQVGWNPSKLRKPNGKVNGFWGVDTGSEAFLDQLCTWREIGFNMCARQPDYDRFESLPEWARETMRLHAGDERPHTYTLQQFEQAETHDPIWNAAQRQLVREGRIHNYLRMLWGKKIYHWSPSGRDALATMIELNNKYALDGRDPNSYSGIFWVLGRYDRAWGPERPIFGKLRYMTSENTARKHSLKQYLQRYASLAE